MPTPLNQARFIDAIVVANEDVNSAVIAHFEPVDITEAVLEEGMVHLVTKTGDVLVIEDAPILVAMIEEGRLSSLFVSEFGADSDQVKREYDIGFPRRHETPMPGMF